MTIMNNMNHMTIGHRFWNDMLSFIRIYIIDHWSCSSKWSWPICASTIAEWSCFSSVRPDSRHAGSSISRCQSGDTWSNNTGSSVSIPPPLSQQGPAQTFLHGGKWQRAKRMAVGTHKLIRQIRGDWQCVNFGFQSCCSHTLPCFSPTVI